MDSKKHLAGHLRNFIFGVEDSLVSTVGLVSGIAVAGVSKSEILLTGAILIFVEAFSMGIGSFLSERSAEEFINDEKVSLGYLMENGAIMFLSYFISGFIPLFPYLILKTETALFLSVGLSLLSLFVLGVVSAKLFGINILKSGARMLFIGGIAIAIGVTVGKIFG
ncbi:MAG: VIT1/CCC1 transporter family protein [Candidatus Colwellbacteria bacterium]|nr:VIT1/CCC1 transporter family protein [Candidatus Colwellbacteria bacterium]